jgi:endonuclease YncB( thermonuclease family)
MNAAMQSLDMLGEYLKGVDATLARPFVPALSIAKVVRVYDGDTITVAAPFCNGSVATGPEIYLFSVRLRGIDTPELRGGGPAEKVKAEIARDALAGLVMGRIVRIDSVGSEKYGRVLANVYVDGSCVNEWMVERGFAVAYDSGTKRQLFKDDGERAPAAT